MPGRDDGARWRAHPPTTNARAGPTTWSSHPTADCSRTAGSRTQPGHPETCGSWTSPPWRPRWSIRTSIPSGGRLTRGDSWSSSRRTVSLPTSTSRPGASKQSAKWTRARVRCPSHRMAAMLCQSTRSDRMAERDVFIANLTDWRVGPLVEHPSMDAMPVWLPDASGVVFASDRAGSLGLCEDRSGWRSAGRCARARPSAHR